MDQAQDRLKAAEIIQKALESFVEDSEKSHVHVFESPAGNLRAVIGTKKFDQMSPIQRQEAIWHYLDESVPRETLVALFGVDTKDAEEYAADQFRQRSSAAVDLFIRGTINGNVSEN